MELSGCHHERVEECDELVCIDCGLVLGSIFLPERSMKVDDVKVTSFAPPVPATTTTTTTTTDNVGQYHSHDDDAIRDAVSNALARLFLDSDEVISEAVNVWKELGTYRSIDTGVGRRQLAFTLWKTLTDKGVLREKVDFEKVCGAEPGSISRMEKRKKCQMSTAFIRPSERVNSLGSWLGLPYQHRRIVERYMRSFECKNTYLRQKPEVLAMSSILYVSARILHQVKKGRARGVRLTTPEYMKHITPAYLADLIEGEREELKNCYNALPKLPKNVVD